MSSAQLQPPSMAGPVNRPATLPASHPVTPSQLAWLDSQLRAWQAEGVVDETAAAAIRGRYVAVRRVTIVRVVLSLGSAFVAVGLIWLVAANLDRFAPLARFVLIAAIWAALTVVAEILSARRERAGDVASPVVGAARFLAAASFAAVVFQAAQSLQVPAYDASLLGYSALGALVYAYAVRDLAPLVLAVVGLAVWYVWQVTASTQSLFGFAVAALVGAVVATAVAVAHRARWWPEFATPWREMAAVVALIGMFVAAIPRSSTDQATRWSFALVLGSVLAVALALAAAWLGRGWDRAEVGLVVAALALGIGLSAWWTEDLGADRIGAAGYGRAALAVAAYLLVATGYAALGALRDSPRLTVVATVALVVFVTFQAFAVFAPILSGSALFLTVGVILIVSGYLADRGRRRLVAQVEGEVS